MAAAWVWVGGLPTSWLLYPARRNRRRRLRQAEGAPRRTPDEAMNYADEGIAAPDALVATMGELPELRDAMSLVWRILLLWLAVLALFAVAGWLSRYIPLGR